MRKWPEAYTDELLCLCSFVDYCFMLSIVPREVKSKYDCVIRIAKEEMVNNSKQESPSLRLTLTSSISHVPEKAELELPPSKKLK